MTDEAPAAAPPAAPIETETDVKAKLHAAALKRAQVCMAEIHAALAAHRCKVVAQTVIYYDGRAPQLQWDVEPIV